MGVLDDRAALDEFHDQEDTVIALFEAIDRRHVGMLQGGQRARFALETGQAERLLKVLEQDGRVRCVTWGHVHQDFRAERSGMLLLGAPSTVANGVPGREKFTLDENGPACRLLLLGQDGSVEIVSADRVCATSPPGEGKAVPA